MKKILAFALALLTLAFAAVGLCACNDSEGPTDPELPDTPDTPSEPEAPEDPDEPESPEATEPEPAPETPAPKTVGDLVSNHKDTALDFISELFQNASSGIITRYRYSFEVNSDGKITAVSAFSIEKGEGDMRKLVLEKEALSTPISPDSVIGKSYKTSPITSAYSRDNKIDYDARENYLNNKLREKLMSFCKVTSGECFFEKLEDTASFVKYKLSSIDTNTFDTKIYEITAKLDTNGKLVLFSSEADSVKLLYEISLGDYQIDYLDYKVEEFQLETVEELLTYYSEEIQTALQENFYAGITKKMFGITFDTNKVKNAEWRIAHEDNKITGFQLIITYTQSETGERLCIGSAALQQPIDVKDIDETGINEIIAKSLSTTTFTKELALSYNTAEQGQHDDLVNAIFEAKGMGYDAPAGATRYFVNEGARLDADLGEANQISVLQIENGKVTMITLYVKNSNGTYDEMLASLKTSSGFKVITEQSCDLSETSLNLQITETEPELAI